MSLVLDLPPELETELATEAARLGLNLSEYALRLIASGLGAHPELHTGAELVSYWQAEGLIGTRPEIADSHAYSRALRRRAERRPSP